MKDAAHCLMRAISTANGKVKVWYDALEDLESFWLASIGPAPNEWLRRKGGKSCFSRRTAVGWVEVMFNEFDIVLENLPAILLHIPEYINNEADLRRRDKAQSLFDALSHPLFNFTAAFFCDVFVVVCATSKKARATRGAQVATVQDFMNVMCTQLLHTMRHVIPMGGRNRWVLR